MGALERMRDELGRARRRGAHVLMPEEVPSPMDLNPTIEVSAAIIADCALHADRYRMAAAGPAIIPVIDEALRQVAFGASARRLRRDPA